jgi:nonsense-mediated mRNA decay protein 3
MGGRDQKKVEEDYELFLRDLEEDPELRGTVNLYKASKDVNMDMGSRTAASGKSRKKTQFSMDVDESAVAAGRALGSGDVEVVPEPDFPEIRLDELLEGFDEMTLGEAEPQI